MASERMEKFAEEFVKDQEPIKAMIRAGYSGKVAPMLAAKALANDEVLTLILEHEKKSGQSEQVKVLDDSLRRTSQEKTTEKTTEKPRENSKQNRSRALEKNSKNSRRKSSGDSGKSKVNNSVSKKKANTAEGADATKVKSRTSKAANEANNANEANEANNANGSSVNASEGNTSEGHSIESKVHEGKENESKAHEDIDSKGNKAESTEIESIDARIDRAIQSIAFDVENTAANRLKALEILAKRLGSRNEGEDSILTKLGDEDLKLAVRRALEFLNETVKGETYDG